MRDDLSPLVLDGPGKHSNADLWAMGLIVLIYGVTMWAMPSDGRPSATCSRASHGASSCLHPSGFDQAQEVRHG
jgi:hypothetical protein